MKEANYIAQQSTGKDQDDYAQKVYDDALSLDPFNGDIHLFRGMFFQKMKNNEEALKEFLEAKRYFDLPQISLDLGALYFEKGELFYDHAETAFRDSLGVYPNYPLPRYNLGLIFYQKGVNILNKMNIQILPETSPAQTLMATKDNVSKPMTPEQQARDYLQKAAEMFKESVDINPTLDTASFKLALTYEKMGDIPSAMKWYEYTMRISPNNRDAMYNYGLVLSRLSSLMAAKGNQANKLGMKADAQKAFASASIYQKTSRDYFERATISDPNNVKALNNLANTYFSEGKIEQALDMYKKALKADPTYLNARLNISLAYMNLRRYNEALPYLEDILKVQLEPPIELKTIFMLSTCYIEMKRIGEAEAILSTAISKYRNTSFSKTTEFNGAALRYAHVLDITGKAKQAVDVLDGIMNNPMDKTQMAEAIYRLGVSCANSGQYQRAKQAFTQYVNQFPGFPYANEARINLQKLGAIK